MTNKGESILVTGGAGYVGSHVCKALQQSGFKPVTIDNLATGHKWAVKWGPFEHGDIRDQGFVRDVVARHKVTAIMHFAASSLVGESAARPLDYYDNNLSGALSLVRVMERSDIRRFVFSSTCAVYGMPDNLPIEETEPTRPINVYGRTKLAVENLLSDVAATGTIRVATLRYFNAAGADAAGEIGEAHDPETHLIPLVIRAALEPGHPISVFGNDYPTADGTCERDYVHVQDLAQAHLRALSFLEKGSGGNSFNLGSGKPVSVRQVVASVERILGVKVAIADAPRRAGDPPRLFAAPGRAERELGWTAKTSDIDSIVESAVRWYRNRPRVDSR